MKVGNLNDPGDLVQLKQLCEDYGLGHAAATTSQRNTSLEERGPEKCESDCALVCSTCYIKP